MGLETGTYISDLVATNPVGAVDPKSQGDNHLRLIKSTLLATFPSITGAVTATHTELNYIDGATGVTGTGNTVRSDAPTFTGTLTAQSIIATGFAGSGGSITNLSASNLASGTVPDARFPATLPAASGANLTALNGTNISSGTVADARISTALARLAGTTTFSANQTITAADNGATLSLIATTGRLKFHAYHSSFGGGFLQVRDGGDTAAAPWYVTASLTTLDSPVAFTGALTTPNLDAAEVGFKGLPQQSKSVDYTAVLTDAAKDLHQTGASKTFTIPANGSVAYPIGTALTFSVSNATGVTIAITTDTLRLAGVGTTGSRTLAQYGVATALKIAATEWYISGAGLT